MKNQDEMKSAMNVNFEESGFMGGTSVWFRDSPEEHHAQPLTIHMPYPVSLQRRNWEPLHESRSFPVASESCWIQPQIRLHSKQIHRR
jgi:hypothetical protein